MPLTVVGDKPPRQRGERASASQPPARRAPPAGGRRPAAPPAADQIAERDSYAVTAFADIVDRSLNAAAARSTAGLSPAALAEAYLDWATHLAFAPGKRVQLIEKAARKTIRFLNYAQRCALQGGTAECCIEPLPHDRRFVGEQWHKWPYSFIHQSFVLTQQWWHNATTGVRGVTRQHEAVVEFAARQLLDMVSPSNFLMTNPEVIERTIRQGGANFANGFRNLLEDWERAVSGRLPVGTENFEVGRDVAITPGKVVYRNRLIELIQYEPSTSKVRSEPVLIVPAWIMKYYILDLSPQNSLVKYLTGQGFTVFMVSWKNPTAEDRDLGMDDYRALGVMDAIDTVREIVPDRKMHAVGYCLGGTLLAIAAAAMARDGDDRLQSVTLLAAQTDFHEAGELMLFINESQLAFLEDMMWEQGFLDTRQMAGTFQMLRSNDMVWSYMVRNYLMGERRPMTDLMAWNADATRMPYRMHSEYLRSLFLNNELSEGRYVVGGHTVALSDVHVPVFAVGTEWDHVAPWRSTYKIHLLTNTEVTYLLTTGGHNAGIVSEPGRDERNFRVMTTPVNGHYVDPETWLTQAPRHEGSWWPEWVRWLHERSGPMVAARRVGAPGSAHPPLGDAPGVYVLQQ